MARNSLLDLPEMKPTPRNQLYGFFADVLGGIDNYAQRPNPVLPMGKANPPLSLLSEFAGLPGLSRTLDRLSYGEPLTTGRGMTTTIRPDTLEAATAVLPVVAKFPRAALGAAGMMAGAADLGGAGRAMFIGPTAKTWDKAAAATAQKLEKAGAEPRAIWSETGTFKGPDGKWRQEISDQGAGITDAVFDGIKATQRFEGPMADALSHPALYQAYPDTGKIGGGFYAWRTPEGSYQSATDTITAGGPGTTSQKSAALHELQHAIQQREAFARGGSPGDMPLIFEDLAARKRQEARGLFDLASRNDPLDPGAIVKPGARAKGLEAERQASDFDSMRSRLLSIGGEHEAYRRLAGEAEARATQARMNMTPAERRATFPYDSYDVPVNQLIVRQDGLLGPQMSVSAPQAEALETARKNAVKMLGLPENNTAMDRAKALGFKDEGLMHGTTNDFQAFSGPRDVYATDSPQIADIYATATGRHKALREVNAGPNVLPLMSRGERLEVSDFREGGGGWMRENLSDKLGVELPRRGYWKSLPDHGYQSAKVEMDDLGGRQQQYIFPDPKVLRSRFAAFDPARVNENDLLGRADPALLALIAAGTGGYALTNRKRKDEPPGQLSGLLAP